MAKSKAQLITEIKQSLGWPTINLEVEDSHFEFGVNKSIEMYHKFAYGRALHKNWILLSAVSGTSAYDVPSSVQDVLKTHYSDTVAGNINTLFTAENLLWNMGYLNVWNWLDGHMGLVSYELTMQYLDLIQQMIPSKYWLRYIPQTQQLYIQPTPTEDTLFMAEVMEKVDATGLYHEHWVYEWARAEVMEVIGHIRQKYGTLPGPGGNITLNGTEMITEAKAEKSRLKTDLLHQESEPLDFFLG